MGGAQRAPIRWRVLRSEHGFADTSALLAATRELCIGNGVAFVARRAGIDPANLRAVLSRRRVLSSAMDDKLSALLCLLASEGPRSPPTGLNFAVRKRS